MNKREQAEEINRALFAATGDVDAEIIGECCLLKIDLASRTPDLSDWLKIKLNFDGTWEYERETDDGRDPYNRDMREPYEP